VNTLPKIKTRREHRKQLATVHRLITLYDESKVRKNSSFGRFLRELAERVEEYEKVNWPITKEDEKLAARHASRTRRS
jgi:GrpB-like predicted nucleotidyltransferase (UPF0157 family)